MPTFGHTPEALLGRNDSKNPTTTCKGLTASGRPCRRALGDKTRKSSVSGVVALFHEDGEIQEADFYCWQHQDQAQERNQGRRDDEGGIGLNQSQPLKLPTLRERNSIDTFMERLDIHGSVIGKNSSSRSHRNQEGARRKETHDRSRYSHYEKQRTPEPSATQRAKPKRSAGGFWASLCCLTVQDDDYVEIVRHRKRMDPDHQRSRTSTMKAAHPTIARQDNARPARPTQTQVPPTNNQKRSAAIPNTLSSTLDRHTDQFLSLIPAHLAPQTTSALLAELIKPISPTDEEGYIYIFWLTPQAKAAPPEATARSLLTPTSRPRNERRISDVMTEFSYDGNEKAMNAAGTAGSNDHSNATECRDKRTILLKIGRASNLTRRMNEWQRQCGYALTLVRWYPYIPSSSIGSGGDRIGSRGGEASSPSFPSQPRPSPQSSSWQDEINYPDLSQRPSQERSSPQQRRRQSSAPTAVDTVRKVPCVKRVERLIHLELAGQQVKRQCEVCGKEHREWFRIEASQAGVRAVDETVKRWVSWAQRNGAMS